MVTFSDEWFIQLKKADISTLDGWQEFVVDRNSFQPPPRFDRTERAALSSAERVKFDLARRIANINLRKLETPMTLRVREALTPMLEANVMSSDPGVRAGMFISADGGLGKSTLVREVAADFDNNVRGLQRLAPGLIPHSDRWVPVAWVTVPPKLTIRNLARAILEFYGAPYRNSDTDGALTKNAAENILDCGTRLLVLDDITRFRNNEPDQQASDWIRNLMETSVSVVAMGVDVYGSGILYDGKTRREQRLRTQTARRFPVIEMQPFSYDTRDDIGHWIAHLRAVEDDLHLMDTTPGMLSEDLAEFLFERTQGVIGILARWVSITAMKAVGRPESKGGEVLTRQDFESTPVPMVPDLKSDLDPRAGAPSTRADRTRTSRASRATKKATAAKRAPRRNTMYDQPPRERPKDEDGAA